MKTIAIGVCLLVSLGALSPWSALAAGGNDATPMPAPPWASTAPQESQIPEPLLPPPPAPGAVPSPAPAPTVLAAATRVSTEELGLTVQDLAGEAVVIERVQPGSAAAAAGLAAGDLILRAGNRRVLDATAFASVLAAAVRGGSLELKLLRAGRVQSATVPIPAGTVAAAAQPSLAAAAAPSAGRAVQVPELGVEVAPAAGGVQVERVYVGSKGERGGLRAGDLLLSVAGQAAPDLATFLARLSAMPAEQTVELGLVRDRRLRRLRVMLGEGELEGVTVPGDAARPFGATIGAAAAVPRGTTAASQLGLELLDQPFGVVVLDVKPASPADRAGVRPGDLLLQVGPRRLPDSATLERCVQRAGAAAELRLKVLRGGKVRWRTLSTGAG